MICDIIAMPRPVLGGEEKPMSVNLIVIQPLVALIAGILILIMPRLLNIIIALYLIFIGVVGLFGDRIAPYLH